MNSKTKTILLILLLILLLGGLITYLTIKKDFFKKETKNEEVNEDINNETGVPSARANFEIDFSSINLGQGEWILSFYPIDAYYDISYYNDRKPNHSIETIEEAKSFFDSLKKQYISIKFNQWNVLQDYPNYNSKLSFAGIHYWFHKYSDTVAWQYDSGLFPPMKCTIEDKMCIVSMGKSNERFFMVLENLDSPSQVYFSGIVEISYLSDESIQLDPWEPKTYTLNLENCVMEANNYLNISFRE